MASQAPIERISLLNKHVFSELSPETDTAELFKLSVISLVKNYISSRSKHTYETQHRVEFNYDDEVGLGNLEIIKNIVAIVSAYPELRDSVVYACIHELNSIHSPDTQLIRVAELLFVIDPNLHALGKYTQSETGLFVRDQQRAKYERADIQALYPAVVRKMLAYRHPDFSLTDKATLARKVWTTYKDQDSSHENYVLRTFEALLTAVRISPKLVYEPSFPWNELLEHAANPDFIANSELHNVIRGLIMHAPREIVTSHAVGLSKYLKSFADESDLRQYNRYPLDKNRAHAQARMFEQFSDAESTVDIVKNMISAEISLVRVYVRSLDREGKDDAQFAKIEDFSTILETARIHFDKLSEEQKPEVAKETLRAIMILWQEAFTRSFHTDTMTTKFQLGFRELFVYYFEPIVKYAKDADCDKLTQTIISLRSQQDALRSKATMAVLSVKPDYLTSAAPETEIPRWVAIAQSMDTSFYEGQSILKDIFNNDLNAFALACYTYGLEGYLEKSDLKSRPEVSVMKREYVDQSIEQVYKDILIFITHFPEEDVQLEAFTTLYNRLQALQPVDDLQEAKISLYTYLFIMDVIKAPNVSSDVVEEIASLIADQRTFDTSQNFTSSDMRMILRSAPARRISSFETYYIALFENNPIELLDALEAGEISQYGSAIVRILEISSIAKLTGQTPQDIDFSERFLTILTDWFDSLLVKKLKTLKSLETSEERALLILTENTQYRTFCRRIPNFNKKYRSILKLTEKA